MNRFTCKMILSIKIIAVVAGSLLLLQCNPGISGGGSEAGNAKIAGVIVDKDGAPAPNTIVTLLSSDYNPVTDTPIADSCIDTTDAKGCYHFTVAENHTYSIQAVQQQSHLRALITGISVGTEDSSIDICKLSLPGTVRILLSKGNSNTGYIYIPGTNLFSKVKSVNGYTLLDSVPSGVLPEISYASIDSSPPVVLSYNVAVIPGDTTTVLWQNWQYSHELILNTSASGADIVDDLNNFPVLIRLSAANFDFNKCMPNGEDLRFVSSTGKTLFHEIEQWDRNGNQAVIWVKVDTILGNNAEQTITMIWGNPSATAQVNEKTVFDTTHGFEGVWHLGEAASVPFLDATGNRYNGLSPDTARPQQQKGIIGSCQVFDGSADYITMPNTAGGKLNFPADGYFTISAWVSLDTIDNVPQLIVAKGYSQYFLRCTYFPADAPVWEFSEFVGTNSWNACTTTAYARQWSLITGVRAGERHLLYINGALVDSTPNSYISSTLSRVTSNDITIGRFIELVTLPNNTSGYCFFRGAIDEVRIDRGARSSAWVKLCYMNQRSDDRLIRFK
ncbi:MAG TPA: DUF2341 domain-containing protein [Chitinispirillaceae bacterium]|nr:DUF2341 domain-containing protein [Chitinispirillaceae bacterium]